MCQYLRKYCHNLSETVLPLRDSTKENSEFLWSKNHQNAFNSAKKPHCISDCITLLRPYYSRNSASGCVWKYNRRRTVTKRSACLLYIAHTEKYREELRSNWKGVSRNCLLHGKVAPVLVRKTRNHSTYRSSTARDNLQEAFLVSPSTTVAKDAQATKISISSSMQERKGTLSCRHSVSCTCHLSSFNNQCEEGIQSVPTGFGWDGKLSQTESHLK